MADGYVAIVGAGMDAETGKTLYGWPHVMQSLGKIFTTTFGERVMREYLGSLVPVILGRNMLPSEVLPFWAAIWTAIDMFEPRFKVTAIVPTEASRSGQLGLTIVGQYRPRAHLGDFEVEGERRLKFGAVGEKTSIEAI